LMPLNTAGMGTPAFRTLLLHCSSRRGAWMLAVPVTPKRCLLHPGGV
jgi:hypothetical protein